MASPRGVMVPPEPSAPYLVLYIQLDDICAEIEPPVLLEAIGEVFTLPHVFLEDSWQSYQEDQESSRIPPGIVPQPLSNKWLRIPGKFLVESWGIPGGFLVKSGNSW